MTLVVSFAGKMPVSETGSGPTYAVWSYAVTPGAPDDVVIGQRIALALPSAIDIQNPQLYPSAATALAGMFVQQDAASSRQYVGRIVAVTGTQTLSFIAPEAPSTCEVWLLTRTTGAWETVAFAQSATDAPTIVQVLTGPAARIGPAVVPVTNGRAAADFSGTLPYASELFGVYQPLAGWLGRQAVDRARVNGATVPKTSTDPASVAIDRSSDVGSTYVSPSATFIAPVSGWLSPIGLINLFREYFFEFDNFLGSPSGHVWISPGGTVEVIETSTRRTTIEKTAEQSEQTSRKVEEDLTSQDDIADAVKEENANDTKLAVSAAAGANTPVYHAEGSASVNVGTSVKKSAEDTHKRSRTQSSKVTSEIARNFKTTFKTVTDSTDTTSRRYVVQNTTDQLVNYELRRKMRKVGVQVQHIGTRLSWQVYLDAPGRGLGLGDLIHVVPPPDLSSLRKPVPPSLDQQVATFAAVFPIRWWPGVPGPAASETNLTFSDRTPPSNRIDSDDGNHAAYADYSFTPIPPAANLTLTRVTLNGAKAGGSSVAFATDPFSINPGGTGFSLMVNFFNSGDNHTVDLDFTLVWSPAQAGPAWDTYRDDLNDYQAAVAAATRSAYADAVRDRLKLVSSIRTRPSDDLRDEERQTVYGNLVRELQLTNDAHLDSELIRQIFDVDEMLYFAVPEYWNLPSVAGGRTRTASSYEPPAVSGAAVGRSPVPDPNAPVPQEDWRYCDKCHGLFFSATSAPGACPAGDAHSANGFNYVLPHDVPSGVNTQGDWRYCNRCNGLFFDGHANKGTCPAGGGHTSYGFDYILLHDVVPGVNTQGDWRYCGTCQVLFFDRPGDHGTCPVGGVHAAFGFNYVLVHDVAAAGPLADSTVVGWYSVNATDNLPGAQTGDPSEQENRIDYLITEDTQPAPMGSSLGWMIQIDGDERRNAFLNAAWVKAVLPVRPGHELDALIWLRNAVVEGESNLDQDYPYQPGDPAAWQGMTLGEVLTDMATGLQAANTDINNTLATEVVYEHGFDPLDGGFRPADPYQIFDQWIEVLPTDQIVAVEVTYDPRSGLQL